MMLYLSIIIVHELGHFLVAKKYHWNTDHIYIYPLGGITKLNEDINRPLKEELMIVLAGPIFQILYYVILSPLVQLEDFSLFHTVLLLFNLLPIYPLDGGKILLLLLCFFFPYRSSYRLTMWISYGSYFLLLGFLLLRHPSLFLILVLFFLFIKIKEEKEKEKYYFHKFLLERYLSHYHFKKVKVVPSTEKMYKDCTHIFSLLGRSMTEKEMLASYFEE